MAQNPTAGDVIRDTGGLRKIRVASGGHGKRGGFRVIYYHFAADARIALLLIYPKSEKDDLSVEDRKALKAMIEKWR
ncbi:type II toxin-antitoxin system RelE/ParE family toxin [Pseudomonas oryzihabitans]|uniref:type II toxin-antitoxin system RelE/ParE family toxin n=1 Tax=Pseudomonas oryzihabitans TaxID=47885 RepID=UPI001FCFA19F|nr:type II toxin-antitoxin system RelE/ParE family toxin [Pseudomonas oryzihabitans]